MAPWLHMIDSMMIPATSPLARRAVSAGRSFHGRTSISVVVSGWPLLPGTGPVAPAGGVVDHRMLSNQPW